MNMMNQVGKKTKAVVRFSTVGGEKGSPDTARDPRGFAIKFYTEEGNLDWVFNKYGEQTRVYIPEAYADFSVALPSSSSATPPSSPFSSTRRSATPRRT